MTKLISKTECIVPPSAIWLTALAGKELFHSHRFRIDKLRIKSDSNEVYLVHCPCLLMMCCQSIHSRTYLSYQITEKCTRWYLGVFLYFEDWLDIAGSSLSAHVMGNFLPQMYSFLMCWIGSKNNFSLGSDMRLAH